MDWAMSTMQYSQAWRVRRRAFHNANISDQILEYEAGQLADAHALLRALLDDPQDFIAACRASVAYDTNSLHTTNLAYVVDSTTVM
jgi:hypothetical protein